MRLPMRLGVRARGCALVSLFVLLCSVLIADGGIEDFFIQPGSNSIDAGECVAVQTAALACALIAQDCLNSAVFRRVVSRSQ